MSFTVTLSDLSSNAKLGSPATVTVKILDHDKPPVADIEIQGIKKTDKNNPGGFVQVNANNDNGSDLCYVDENGKVDPKRKVPENSFGVPVKRDFDPDNVKLKKADPDLLQINLSTANLKDGGPEVIWLTVKTANKGRAKIQIWDKATKDKLIVTPQMWTKANMPKSVFVEGLLEGASLREITLYLRILDGGVPVSSDTCALTVTPVLTDLVVEAAMGAAPGIKNDGKILGWILNSAAGRKNEKDEAFVASASAEWRSSTAADKHVRGFLRFVQTTGFSNNLKGGSGADLGPRKWDFDGKNAGKYLVDSNKQGVPFYTLGEPNQFVGATVKNSVYDSPALPISKGDLGSLTTASCLLREI